MNMLKALYELKEYKRAAELIEDLKYARKYLDSQLGREVIEEILSKSESSPNPNNK
jgi:hypothetical protein